MLLAEEGAGTSIDARDPRAIVLTMSVDVMHSARVPALS